MLKIMIILMLSTIENVVGQIRSFNDNIKNKPLISLNTTLVEIYSEPKFVTKQHYLGPNFKIHNDGRITSSCRGLFQSVLKDNGEIKECTAISEELQRAFTLDHLINGAESCPPKKSSEKQNGSKDVWV